MKSRESRRRQDVSRRGEGGEGSEKGVSRRTRRQRRRIRKTSITFPNLRCLRVLRETSWIVDRGWVLKQRELRATRPAKVRRRERGALAVEAGAEIHGNERVLEWSEKGGRVRVVTSSGDYDAGRVALCAGAWNPKLMDDETLSLRVERQVMNWFTPARDAELFTPARCPIAMVEYATDRIFYFVPDSGDGVKAAIHHEGEVTDPDLVRREVTDEDVAPAEQMLKAFLPAAAGRHRASATCLYTNTRDGHFLLAPHAHSPEVLIVSACSGHGFKFASAIGEAVADLLMGMPRPDLAPFGRQRDFAEQSRA